MLPALATNAGSIGTGNPSLDHDAMKKPPKRSRPKPPAPTRLDELAAAVCRFRDDRDWAQFHRPKDLAAAIAIEAAELQERFLWKTDAEVDRELTDAAKRAGVADEIADVVMFAMLLADRLGIDLAEAITAKLAANERKYPVKLARGNARKYTDLRDG